MRAFIAISLPQEIRDILDVVIVNLEKVNRRTKVKWTKPENLHLTLHFLDEINDAQVQLVLMELEKVTAEYKKVDVSLGEIGAFPDKNNPRAIFVEIIDSQILEKIQKKIGFELKRLNVPMDLRPWKSHVTLGRIKTGLVNISTPVPTEKFTIKNIELVKSTLTPDGPIYEVIKSFELR